MSVIPRVSIIIVNYNTRILLEACLDSIFESLPRVDLEVIVVDNNSSDDSVKMVNVRYPEVRLVCNRSNLGFAAANNAGIALSRGSFILLLNSDTILVEDVLVKSVHYLEQHPEVGALGCKILHPDGSIQPSARRFPTLVTIFLEALFVYTLFPRHRVLGNPWITDHDSEQEIDVVKGAYLLTRREIFRDVGMLDERFFLYSEEQDWCFRAKKKGWRIMYWPDGSIVHYEGASSKVTRNSVRFYLFDSEAAYFRKHFGPASARLALLGMFLAVILRLGLWSIVCCADAARGRRIRRHVEKIRYYWFAFLWFVIHPPLNSILSSTRPMGAPHDC